jgi:hypothetical protein
VRIKRLRIAKKANLLDFRPVQVVANKMVTQIPRNGFRPGRAERVSRETANFEWLENLWQPSD